MIFSARFLQLFAETMQKLAPENGRIHNPLFLLKKLTA